jgi:hypothetical protein
MKIKSHFIYLTVLSALVFSCAKDNFTEPKSKLSGQILYKGEPIGVESGLGMQLWQPGFGKLGAINVFVDPTGSYSAILFNGDYKVVFPKGRGPFRTIEKDAASKDTLYLSLGGDQKLDVEVMPYYMIRTANFSGGENRVNVSAGLEKIITDANARDVERVSLYISKTQHVSRAVNIGVTDVVGSTITNLNNIIISTNVPTIVPAQDYVYARVGVKIKDVEDMIFSPVQKVNL